MPINCVLIVYVLCINCLCINNVFKFLDLHINQGLWWFYKNIYSYIIILIIQQYLCNKWKWDVISIVMQTLESPVKTSIIINRRPFSMINDNMYYICILFMM